MIDANRGRLVVGACLLTFALTAPARATSFGEVEVIVASEPKGPSGHGYFEYVFLVSNRSADRSHTVTLAMPGQRRPLGMDLIRDLRRTVQVGPNEMVRVALLQPDYPMLGGSDVAVTIDGQRQESEVPLRPNQTDHGRYVPAYGRGGYTSVRTGSGDPLVLMSRGIHKTFPIAKAPSGTMGMMGGSGMSGMPPGVFAPAGAPAPGKPPPAAPAPAGLPPNTQFAFADPVEIWSGNWLAYSRYDGIVVTSDDLKAMAAPVRTALWQYVETGGSLLVLGAADLDGLAVTHREKTKEGWEKVQAGFGVCLLSPSDDIDKWDAARLAALSASWHETAAPWVGERNTYEANRVFPVVDDLGLPLKGLFSLMLLFTLAIGPLNFLVLAHKKRRIWLLWTTPVISFFTCLAVFGYMLISEGWHGSLRTETLTLLDETNRRATTIGWTAIYSPLTPSDGLHFGYETEVVSQRMEENWRSGGRSCTLDWSRDQHFASGWVEARVPAHFKIRKSEARRERVAVHREADGKLSIVNGLGAELRRFWYADEKGELYAAEHVAPGARAVLAMADVSKLPPGAVQSMRQLLGTNWLMSMQTMTMNPSHRLRPRTYLAEIEDSPFLEDALRDAKTRKCRALVLGSLNNIEEP